MAMEVKTAEMDTEKNVQKETKKGAEMGKGTIKKGVIRKEIGKKTVQEEIEKRINRGSRGQLYFPADFRGLSQEGALKMALSRLAKIGKVKRVAYGVYMVPVFDSEQREVVPTTEEIIERIAVKELIRLRPTGEVALFKLRLSSKDPGKGTYLTDGASRKIRIGNDVINLRATSAKKLAGIGEVSGLIILALEELGTGVVDAAMKPKLRELLMRENPLKLKHDLRLTSVKVADFLFELLSGK
jgi:hypothetical protein